MQIIILDKTNLAFVHEKLHKIDINHCGNSVQVLHYLAIYIITNSAAQGDYI